MTNAFVVLQMNAVAWKERMHFAIVTNVLVLETNMLKARVQTSVPHCYTCSYTSNFQAELLSNLLHTGTHLRKQVVAKILYSPERTLHPQVIHLYTITFIYVEGLKTTNRRPLAVSVICPKRAVSQLFYAGPDRFVVLDALLCV